MNTRAKISNYLSYAVYYFISSFPKKKLVVMEF